jgi:hypothetical protein
MTAQIILTNQLGIAVASDTTTTIGKKALRTTSKIVALPWPHRVAVLDAGMVFVGGLQGRFLLTEWVLSLGDPLPTLEAYVESFAAWVGEHVGDLMVDDDVAMRDVARGALIDLWTMGDSEWAALAHGDPAHPVVLEAEQLAEALSIIDDYCERNHPRDPYPDLVDGGLEALVESSGFDPTPLVDEFLDNLREELNVDGGNLRSRLGEFVLGSLVRFVGSSDLLRLNFAGYGSDEMFPAHAELKVRSIYGGRLRSETCVHTVSKPWHSTQWFPIAQQDAMADMLRGMSSERRAAVISIAAGLVDDMEKLDDEDKQRFRDGLHEGLDGYFGSHFERYANSTIRSLSLPALAYYADLLVEIQSMRSEIDRGPVSVGGPIECLTISRARGVEWSRRLSTHTDDRTGEVEIGR